MIFAFGKLTLILLALMTVVYVILSLWSRSVRREKLEREWDEEIGTGDREAFVQEGLERYDSSVRRKLILGVYVVPFVLIGTIIYLTNYN